MSMLTTLQATGVGIARGGRQILRDVDITIEPGRLHVIVGPNGAGKSTLLAVLAGDLAAETGTVRVAGIPLAELAGKELARRRAVMLQEHRIAFPFRAIEVVAMGRAPWVGTDSERSDELVVAEAMTVTDTTAYAQRQLPTLSGGEKARVAFARTLAQETPILLLDEPTAALDVRHQDDLLSFARTAARAGCAVAIVMHDLTLTGAYADDVTLLHDGRVSAQGSPTQVLRSDTLSRVYDHPITVLDLGEPHGLVVLPRHGGSTR